MRNVTTYTCPQCRSRTVTLADEYGDYGCNGCGWDPEAEREATEELWDDIASYVERCVERKQVPDAFAFSLSYQPRHNRVPGDVIDEMITGELTKYGDTARSIHGN